MDQREKGRLLYQARRFMSGRGYFVPAGDVESLDVLDTRRVAFCLALSDAVIGREPKLVGKDRLDTHPAKDRDAFWDILKTAFEAKM